MRKLNRLFIIAFTFCSLIQIHIISNAQKPFTPNRNFVLGGQFKDFFLPMPINGKLVSDGIWGAANVLPRDIKNGVEDAEWSYWGGNIIKGNDEKYHIAICRWREETGHWGWPDSEVAHAVSENPTGPYKVSGTLLEKGHNPEVLQLEDGSYLLHISGAKVYASDKLTGPWKLLGKMEIDTRGYKGLSHLETNLTGVEREDGSFLFFTKRGDVMISNNGILGPFNMVSAHNYNRYTGYPEDPVIWKSRHQYHVVYNHAVEKKSVHMRSLDGINWIIEPGVAYDNSIFGYTDGTTNKWVKFERPKVLQDDLGRATHMSLGVIDVEKKLDLGNDKHSSKHIVLPLQLERKIEIARSKEESSITPEIKLRIYAEPGFNPANEVELASLQLGTSTLVNYGRGAKPVRSEIDNKGLIVVFNREEIDISYSHYDLKLLGKTKSGELMYGYALLPGFTDNPASLVTLPITFEKRNNKIVLHSKVENYGLQTSKPCKLQLKKYQVQEWEVYKEWSVPALQSYEGMDVEVELEDIENAEYEISIVDEVKESGNWIKVDDSHYTIMYKGNWSTNTKGEDIYRKREQLTFEKNASATFFFAGTQARCYGNIGKLMGSARVFIDDTYIETIDCFFGADIHNTVIYQTPVLPLGLHKLEIRVCAEHYKGNAEAPVAIDAFSFKK